MSIWNSELCQRVNNVFKRKYQLNSSVGRPHPFRNRLHRLCSSWAKEPQRRRCENAINRWDHSSKKSTRLKNGINYHKEPQGRPRLVHTRLLPFEGMRI